MTGQISRRDVLGLSGTVLGGISVLGERVVTDESTDATIAGWITKGSKAKIVGQTGVVEAIEDPGTTMCNSGELYRCQTCNGVECYLLVGFGTPQPSVGASYRFVPTNEDNWCGNFRVELQPSASCDDGTTTDEAPANESESSPETTTETTETTTQTNTDTPTEETPEPTTEETTEATPEPATDATTEQTTELTTEATPEPTTEATPEPTTEATPEPTTESTPEPTTEATPEPTTEKTPELTTESTPEPTTDQTTDAAAETAPEPPTETTAED